MTAIPTDGPATGGQATGGPATDGPATDGPATGGPATGGPATDGQATDGQATDGRRDQRLLGLAVRAARQAGERLLRSPDLVTLIGHKSTGTDPVTDADLASEAIISALLTGERPDDGLLGEEGTARESRTGLRWTIDPLDGTVNLRYGLPHVAVSIACEQWLAGEIGTAGTAGQPGIVGNGGGGGGGWRALVGVVHDPNLGETFTAIRGHGAWLNDEPITVNDPVALPSALVATGFAYGAPARARQAATVGPLLPRIRDIRSAGSAALALCWLAAGRWDAYYEDELAPWDWAAGALIASEAGALVSPLGTGVVAAGPGLYPALAALVAAPAPPATADTAIDNSPDQHQHSTAADTGTAGLNPGMPT